MAWNMLEYLCAKGAKDEFRGCVCGTEEGSTIHGCRCGGRTVKEQFDTLIQFVSAGAGVRLLSRRTKNGTRKRMCHDDDEHLELHCCPNCLLNV